MQILDLTESRPVQGGLFSSIPPIVEALSISATFYIDTAKWIESMNYFSEFRTNLLQATAILNQFGTQLGEDIFTITHPNLGK